MLFAQACVAQMFFSSACDEYIVSFCQSLWFRAVPKSSGPTSAYQTCPRHSALFCDIREIIGEFVFSTRMRRKLLIRLFGFQMTLKCPNVL